MEHDYSDIIDRSRSRGHHELLKKLDEYKNLTEKLRTENRNQLATVNNLQSKYDSLKYQSIRLSESQTENTQLRADLHSTQVNEKDLIKKNRILTQRVAHLESLTDKNEGEIQRLKTETQLEDVLKDGDVRTRQEHRELVMADQMQLTSLTEKHGKENQELKTGVQALKYKLEEAQRLILSKDNLVSKQCREITCKENLRQNAWPLESQAIEHLQQESPDVEVEQESPDVEVEQESPDVEVPQQASPSCYCKWLLLVFLCLCIVAVCVFNLAPPLLDCLASHWDCTCELIRPLVNHQPIPF